MTEWVQSVIVTGAAAVALAVMLRPLMPRRKTIRPETTPGCPSCSTGEHCDPAPR